MIAVFSVMLGHITHQGPIAHPELDTYPIRFDGQYGAVSLMVVSGYFVCQTIRRGHTGRWWWRKVARLLPPYLIAVVITYLVMRMAGAAFNGQWFAGGWWNFLFGPTSDGLAWVSSWYVPVGADLVVNLLMIQGFHEGFIYIDGSYWTLPVQLLVFSVAAVAWSRARWLWAGRVQLLPWVAVIGPLVIRFWIFGAHNDSPLAFAAVNGFGLHRMHAFGAGLAIWLWAHQRMSGRWLTLLLIAAVCAQDWHMYPDHVELPGDPARVPSILGFAVMLLLMCWAAKGPDWTFLRPLAPVITWLAGISYGVYLVHQELGYLLAKALLEAGFDGWARLPIVVVAAIGAGWLLTVTVERPAFRRLTVTKSRPPVPPAPRQPPGGNFLPPATGAGPISVGGAS